MKKNIFYFLLLFSSIANIAFGQFTINCDPAAVFNKILDLSTNDPSTQLAKHMESSIELNGGIENKTSGFGFNNQNIECIGTLNDTCFIIDALNVCNIASSNSTLYCCITNGVASYTLLKPANSINGQVPGNFISMGTGIDNGVYGSFVINNTIGVIEFNGSANGSNNGNPPTALAEILCDTCIERHIRNYLEDMFKDTTYPNCSNYSCSIRMESINTTIFPPTVSLNASTSGCNGTEVPMGWTGEHFPLGSTPKRILGGGYSCPSDNLAFPPGSMPGASGGGGAQYCFKSVCIYPYGIRCTTECCINICMNISGPLKSAGAFSYPIGLEVFPNPAKDNLSINLNSKSNDVIRINIMALDGKEVSSYFYTVSKGFNKYDIDVKGYSKGLYYINIQSKDFKETKSFFKE